MSHFVQCELAFGDGSVAESTTDKILRPKSQVALVRFELQSNKTVEEIVSISVKLDGKLQIISIYLKEIVMHKEVKNDGKKIYSYVSDDRGVGCTIVFGTTITQVDIQVDYLRVAMLLAASKDTL